MLSRLESLGHDLLYDEINQTTASYLESCEGGAMRPAHEQEAQNQFTKTYSTARAQTNSRVSQNPKLNEQLLINLFPNPAKSEITISGAKDESLNIKITDANGRLILDDQVLLTSSFAKLKLDLQNG